MKIYPIDLDVLADRIGKVLDDELGDCSCHIGYTSRGMVDPQCDHHEYRQTLMNGIMKTIQKSLGR